MSITDVATGANEQMKASGETASVVEQLVTSIQ